MFVVWKEELFIFLLEPEEKNLVGTDPINTFSEEWVKKPCHFSQAMAKRPNTTTWVWKPHAEAHDFTKNSKIFFRSI